MPKVDPSTRITADGKVYRKGRKYYGNRDMYDGEFLDGMKHGQGNLTFHNGDRYIGDFCRNLFQGFGTYAWAPYKDHDTNENVLGKRYEGGWLGGKFHGIGAYVLGTGAYYSGEFKRGLYDGKGTLKCNNGDVYTGFWLRGKANGSMVIKYDTGDVYEGEMQGGKYHGKGKLSFCRKLGSYEGDFERGWMHGKGIRLYSNGNKFVGAFKNGKLYPNVMKPHSKTVNSVNDILMKASLMEMVFSCTSTAISTSANSFTGTRLAEESSATHKETYTRVRFIKVTSLATESIHLQASQVKRDLTLIRFNS